MSRDKWRCDAAIRHVLRPGEGKCIACGKRVARDALAADWREKPPEDGFAARRIDPTTLEPDEWPYSDKD